MVARSMDRCSLETAPPCVLVCNAPAKPYYSRAVAQATASGIVFFGRLTELTGALPWNAFLILDYLGFPIVPHANAKDV